MLDVPFRSARQLAADIKRKKIGCLELLDLYLARVDKYDGALNAVVVRDFDRARTRARAADRALARRQVWGPLHGVPMTIKESYDVVGLPTTWGVPVYKDRIATKNAVAVDRLLGAGVVLFGKTNVPLYLGDWQSFNAIYGTTNNPWDVKRAPGGSSGGSAAALAAGLTGLEAGSDIGSSIRNPAHFCGVFGHKPTWGIVPRAGQALPWQTAPVDIDVVGPLARSADDLAVALAAMAGPDEIDGAGWQLRLAPPRQKRLRDFKVALMHDAPGIPRRRRGDEPPPGTRRLPRAPEGQGGRPRAPGRRSARGVQHLRQAPARRDVGPPERRRLRQERGPRAGRRELLRAGRRARQSRRTATGSPPTRRATACVGPGRSSSERTTCSSAPSPAPRPSRTTSRASATNARWWSTASACRSPITCSGPATPGCRTCPRPPRPAGFTPGGLPVGVQIVGPQYGDLTCLGFARLLEREFQAFVPPPGYA